MHSPLFLHTYHRSSENMERSGLLWRSQAARRWDLSKDLHLLFLKVSAAVARQRCTKKCVKCNPHSSILEGITSLSDLHSTQEPNSGEGCGSQASALQSPCSWLPPVSRSDYFPGLSKLGLAVSAHLIFAENLGTVAAQ